MRMLPLFACLSAVAAAAPEDDFRMQCSACHALDRSVVGPSLIEIAGLYRNDPDGFVNWCLKPGRKRPERIEMPSMAHVGEPALRGIREYILKATEGKQEQKASEADPFAVPHDKVKRPSVQRIFLPEASPAAIAVALPGDLSYCFDATECRLRYVWKGGFIQGGDHWLGNGSSLAAIDGQVIYREEQRLVGPALQPTGGAAPRFLGYTIKDGLPSFRYEYAGVEMTETIRPLPDGTGIERTFVTPGQVPMHVGSSAAATVSSADAPLESRNAATFTITLRWK